MPVNPNIALGAQTPAPVNFLGQMGQMLALKAAAQDVQGGEALRDFYTKGGDATTPEGVRALMAANPKMGMQILKGQSEMSARDVETQTKSLKTIKDNVSLVNSPEGMVEFLKGAYSTPGGALLAKLAPLDKAIAAIPTNPKEFEDYKRNLGLTSDRLFQSADAQLSSRTSLATAGMAANTAANRLAFDKARQDVIEGSDGFIRKDPYGNLYRVEGYGTMRGPDAAPPAAAPLPPAAANAFVTQRPSVNALAPSAPSQGAGPTVANALAMEAQNNIPRPKVPIRQPVAVMKDNKAVLVTPQEAVGMQPATPDAEKAARLQAQQVRDLGLAITNLESAVKPGGLISQSTGSGIGRAYDVAAGFVGNAPKGAIAAAKLAPIADMVLKMVPRFEGPQSDKDTQSYKEAAGQLANPNLPVEIRQEAGKEILRLMKERRDQFVSTDMAREGFGAAPSSGARSYSPQEQQALEWANSNANDPRAAQIKQRLGVQ
jgi:hypothetical protein